jgi:glycine cleavage system regulatory protein
MPTPTLNSRAEQKSQTLKRKESHTRQISRRMVNRQLNRMVEVLEDNRMTISLMGEDRTNIIFYLTELVKECSLNIDESYGTKLQEEHGSFYLVTGPPNRLRTLARRLEDDKDKTVEGESIIPCEMFDLTIRVPDRTNLIHGICSVFKKHRINIRTLWSFLCPDLGDDFERDGFDPSGPQLGQPDPWWAFIQIRVEVSQDGLRDRARLREELWKELQSLYSPEQLAPKNLKHWKVIVKQRQLDSPPAMLSPGLLGGLNSLN